MLSRQLALKALIALLVLLGGPASAFEVGSSGRGAVIEGLEAGPSSDAGATVLLIGGLNGQEASIIQEVVNAWPRLGGAGAVRLLAVPLANPDGAALEFPPTGTAYRDHPESFAIWRWIGIHAPDLVLIAGPDDAGLAKALQTASAAGMGPIPARALDRRELARLRERAPAASAAHRELDRRLHRTALELSEELARSYGHEFKQPIYTEALALIGQLRLGHLDAVRGLAEPYVNGTRDSLARPNSLVLAGHLIFAELARRTGDARYLARVRAAADLGFEPDGELKEAMPFHGEFSDSLFMGTAILAEAGALTGETRYFDMAARHVDFMRHVVLRPDGLYRHQPATDAAWGRGNAFPALGLAWALSEIPADHPARARLLEDYRQHMRALLAYQNEDGLWRNVIDHPGAYPEFSATAMIGFSMQRGIENGWLPRDPYQRTVAKAWRAILARVGPDGDLFDVCESTARMSSLDEYLKRAAIDGVDARGGAMALLFATEMAGLGNAMRGR
jgi:unsaturated rhamnogalacturonyl hydrolase